MPRTMEELEKELDALLSLKMVDPKDINDLREEVVKLQQTLNNLNIPPKDERVIKKKIKRLKARDWFDIFSPDEFEEIDDPNDKGASNA